MQRLGFSLVVCDARNYLCVACCAASFFFRYFYHRKCLCYILLYGVVFVLQVSKKARTDASGSGTASQPEYGIPEGYDFTEWTPPDNYKVEKESASAAAKNMDAEVHPWLKWPGASNQEKINFNNVLAEYQTAPVDPPREIDWGMIRRLGIEPEFNRMMEAQYTLVDGTVATYPMWRRVFTTNMTVYREWCLEFYCTLRVDMDLNERTFDSEKVIHFRLGGKMRHCTVPEFSYLTGMLEREELENRAAYIFLKKGYWASTGWNDDMTVTDYWTKISGNPRHSSSRSKVKEIRSPVLRVFHKLISYTFLHRSNHNDKVLPEDLRLLRLFSEGAPAKYACAPYVLARQMFDHRDSKLVGGHFISKIVERLGLTRHPANSHCSIGVECLMIGMHDLKLSKLIRPNSNRLIAEVVAPVQPEVGEEERSPARQPTPPHVPRDEAESSFSLASIARQLELMQNENRDQWGYYVEDQRRADSRFDNLYYHQQRYQPVLEDWTSRMADQGNYNFPVYAPPEIYTPAHWTGGTYTYPYPPPSYAGRNDDEAGGSDMQMDQGADLFGEHGGTYEGGGTRSVFDDVDP